MTREEKELILAVLEPYVIAEKVSISKVEKTLEELVEEKDC